MSQPALRIVVVGAGFAGLAAATLLARDGHRVTVLERFAQPQALGAGILIQPSGLAALHRLGLYDTVVAQGAAVDHLFGVNPRGRPVVDVRYASWQAGAFGLGLHRGVLFDALWHAAGQAGVTVRTGQEVDSLDQARGDHDLLVLADGAHSRLRGQTALEARDAAYPWGAVWAVLDDPARRQGRTLWQWYRGAGEMLGLMPTGLTPASDGAPQRPVLSLFWSLRADRLDAWRAAGLDAFKAQVRALNPACEDVLDQLHDLEQLTWARYRDVVMPVLHAAGCVVIGDAAHATSPQLGQGTNLALIDAVVLADRLRGASPTGLDAALEAFTAQRRAHLRYYGQASRWLTPLFQSDARVLAALRDAFMAPATHWPGAARLNLRTLVGVQQGWWPWGEALDLDAIRDASATPRA
jgi:2-polyprenyl-6-methoxyphenol hydroxylase-like FAD-dependent oxidoreductase